MTKLEQLIEQLCPDGVEYKALGEIAEYSKTRIPISTITVDDYIGVENLLQNKAGRTTASSLPANTDVAIAFECDDILIGNIRPYLRKIWLADCNGGTNGDVLAIHINDKAVVMPRFLYYVLSSEKFFFYDIQNSKGAKMPRGDKAAVRKYICPVPPIEVQAEIVRILDTFTELTTKLTTELTTELTNRKKQYEYYENTVLFDNNYPRIKLQELCTVNQGLQIPISERFRTPSNNRYIYITVQYLKNPADNQYYIENPNESVICYEDDILVTRTGSTGTIVTGIKGCFHNNFFKVQCNGRVLKKYMLVLLRSKTMYNRMQKAASGGNIMDLPHKKFYNLEVPLPSIEEQQRIIDILDRFDKLCNDISEGLPAEIDARQKQYEYYRDKLLTFKELNNECIK